MYYRLFSRKGFAWMGTGFSLLGWYRIWGSGSEDWGWKCNLFYYPMLLTGMVTLRDSPAPFLFSTNFWSLSRSDSRHSLWRWFPVFQETESSAQIGIDRMTEAECSLIPVRGNKYADLQLELTEQGTTSCRLSSSLITCSSVFEFHFSFLSFFFNFTVVLRGQRWIHYRQRASYPPHHPGSTSQSQYGFFHLSHHPPF